MKEVILLGGGASRTECLYNAETWAVASCLSLPDIDVKKINKVFAIDAYADVKHDLDTAKAHNIPIVSTQWYATEKIPLEEIYQRFKKAYLRPTVSYMMAYAIYQGYDKIKIYGLDQGPQWKYLLHKHWVFFWLGVMVGMGIEYELSKTSTLELPMAEEFEKVVNEIRMKTKKLRLGLQSGIYHF